MIRLLLTLWRGITWWLGYGDGTRPPAEPGPDPPKHQAVRDAKSVLGSFLDALLVQEGPPRKLPEGSPPLRGRELWPYRAKPRLDEPDVASGWQDLQTEEDATELRTWLESSSCSKVTESLTHAVMAFQHGRTIIGHRDPCPLGWGPVAYQGVVAAYQTAWLVTAHAAGVDDGKLARDRRLLYEWLDTEAMQFQPCSGDLVVLHCICERLWRWWAIWRQQFRMDDRQHRLAFRRVTEARQRQRKAWRPRTRRAARRRLTAEYKVECPRKTQRDRSEKALTELETVLVRWTLLNPLSRITGRTACRIEKAQAPDKTGMFSPAIIVGDPGAEGLQHWLIHEAARQCPLPVADPPRTFERVRGLLTEIQPAEDIDPLRDKPWRACLFLWRFYRLWTQSLPDLDEIEVLQDSDFEDTDGTYKNFFEPWDRLRVVIERLPPANRTVPGSCRRELWREMDMVSKSNNNGLDRAEWWQGRMIETFGEKLQVVRDHLLGITRVSVHMPEWETGNAGPSVQ